MTRIFKKISVFILPVLLTASCDFFRSGPENPTPDGKPYSNVFLLYTIGYNNLKGSIDGNIHSLCTSALPMPSSPKVLLLFEHQSVNSSDWTTPTAPCLIRLTSDWNGSANRDTLLTFPKGTFTTDTETMREVLNFIREKFDAESYGVLFSSHGTGWLPERYYDQHLNQSNAFWGKGPRMSFGCEARMEDGRAVSHEMEITDMASGIPYKLDYIIFDACLMGCVEVAYELRGVTDLIAFSQTEVISTGFVYETLAKRLLDSGKPDVRGVCKDYYDKYAKSSATISLVATAKLERLADVCARFFERYRGEIAAVDAKTLQKFVRANSNCPAWLYDLRDLLIKAGISSGDLAELDAALSECVLYAAWTPKFYELPIATDCGLSLFLPSDGTDDLRDFYRNLAWNRATGLVE